MYLEPFAVIGGERYQTLNQVITITFLFSNYFGVWDEIIIIVVLSETLI